MTISVSMKDIKVHRVHHPNPPAQVFQFQIQAGPPEQLAEDVFNVISNSLSSSNMNSYNFVEHELNPGTFTVQHKSDDRKRIRDDKVKIADMERRFSNMEGRLSEMWGRLSETEGKLSETASKLSGTESKLSETASKLSGTESKLSETASKLSGTESKLSETANKLSKMEWDREIILEWEIYSRIARALNDYYMTTWKATSDCIGFVRSLKHQGMNFLPTILTADALRRYAVDGVLFTDALQLYSVQERNHHLELMDRCDLFLVDKIWRLVGDLDRKIIITAWAKRPKLRNAQVHLVPTVEEAKNLIRSGPSILSEHVDVVDTIVSMGANPYGLFTDL